MFTYQPSDPSNPLQDIAYEYDMAGNILTIHDRTPGCGTHSQPDKLDRQFSYDPLNRLLDATGRQCDALPSETPGNPWNSSPCCEDTTRTEGYSEKYEYDPVGNITSLIHSSNSTGFTRNFTISPGSNRLDNMNINGYTYSYIYDDNGNLTKENESRYFEWDYSDRMRVYRYQSDGSEPTAYVYSLYDYQGNRMKKLVRNKGVYVEMTIYIDGIFEHCCRLDKNGKILDEDNTLHVMDDKKHISTVGAGKFSDDNTPTVKYHLGDHLGSSIIVVDDNGSWINHEEFTPYGETSLGGFSRKRYRFTGKEKDEESGLYYHGARYYAPWLGRWISCDPIGFKDGVNLFSYCNLNPIKLIDKHGTEGENLNFAKIGDKAEHIKQLKRGLDKISEHLLAGAILKWIGYISPKSNSLVARVIEKFIGVNGSLYTEQMYNHTITAILEAEASALKTSEDIKLIRIVRDLALEGKIARKDIDRIFELQREIIKEALNEKSVLKFEDIEDILKLQEKQAIDIFFKKKAIEKSTAYLLKSTGMEIGKSLVKLGKGALGKIPIISIGFAGYFVEEDIARADYFNATCNTLGPTPIGIPVAVIQAEVNASTSLLEKFSESFSRWLYSNFSNGMGIY